MWEGSNIKSAKSETLFFSHIIMQSTFNNLGIIMFNFFLLHMELPGRNKWDYLGYLGNFHPWLWMREILFRFFLLFSRIIRNFMDFLGFIYLIFFGSFERFEISVWSWEKGFSPLLSFNDLIGNKDLIQFDKKWIGETRLLTEGSESLVPPNN